MSTKKAVVILFYPATVPEKHPRFSMPYALLYLERAVRDLYIEVVVIDEDVDYPYEGMVESFASRLLLVGVSAMTGRQIEGGIRFSKHIKENHPHVPVLWGGWHASVLPDETLKSPFIDFIIHGQGERPFRELIEALIQKKDFRHISGLGFKEADRLAINPHDGFKDMAPLPPVNFDLIDAAKYVVADTLVYFASHGCVYECGFCAMSTMYKKKWFPKQLSTVIQELKYLKSKTNLKYINFQDDNFFVKRSYTISLCEAIIASGLDFEFITSAHALDVIKYDDDALALLYNAGCRKVYIGAESGSQQVLDLIKKKDTVADNFTALKKLKKHGIITVFSTMVCLPENPEHDLHLTIDMIRRAKLVDANLEILIFYYTPFPATNLYSHALTHGFKPPQSTEEWAAYTMFNPDLPWHTKKIRKKLEYFYNYYFPFYNKNIVALAPEALKPKVRIFIKLFHKLNRLRFRYHFFGFPFEARLMLYYVRKYNRMYKQRFCFSGTWSFFENRYF